MHWYTHVRLPCNAHAVQSVLVAEHNLQQHEELWRVCARLDHSNQDRKAHQGHAVTAVQFLTDEFAMRRLKLWLAM